MNLSIVAVRQPRFHWGRFIFPFLWLLVFVLYIPAIDAGFVADFTGWLYDIQNSNFAAHINREHFNVKSLYQFTQLNTYFFYKLFGSHLLPWHLLHVSLHAVNAYLLYRLFWQLLEDAGIRHSKRVALSGSVLFCVSPYVSEVVVWEPCFHYLQGLLLILLILLCVQMYFHKQRIQYAWYAGILYFLSTYSLEIFYLTPWLILAMILYYRFGTNASTTTFRKALLYFFGVSLLLFAAYLITYRIYYGNRVAHFGSNIFADIPATGRGKPSKHIYHMLFLGRYFPLETRQKIYSFCDSTTGIVLFYTIAAGTCAYILLRFGKLSKRGKAAGLTWIWVLFTMTILLPVWFSDILLVVFDRYLYFTLAFLYMLVALLTSYIPNKYIYISIIVAYTFVNVRFAIKTNRYWGKGSKVIYSLLHDLPDIGNKTVILLNVPQCIQGVPMIGRTPEGEYKLMHNLLLPDQPLSNTIYDAVSYNMTTPEDGAHVAVLNDATIGVTLNQWGTWWWKGSGGGAESYDNEDYSVNMKDVGHYYELTLKKPAHQYALLYSVGGKWKVVDWSRKNEEQY